jgi:hypothetical protein
MLKQINLIKSGAEIKMITGLVEAKRRYFDEIHRTKVDVDRALKMNRLYCNKLFELHFTLTDYEERSELESEIDYLIEQSKVLRDIQLNNDGGNQ